MEDSKTALDLATLILPLAPDVSFGKHDYLIAQALATKKRTSPKQGGLNIWAGTPDEELQLAKTRFELALQQELPAQQKLEAEEIFTAINLAIHEGEPNVRYTPSDLGTVPQGTFEELTKKERDEKAPLWNRGRAAMAIGLMQLDEGKKEQALRSLMTALKRMRSVYPFIGGVKAGSSDREMPDAEECQLMQRLVDEINTLSPGENATTLGEMEFSLAGVDLPKSLRMSIHLQLVQSGAEKANEGLPRSLPAIIAISPNESTKIQLLDGTYKLSVNYSTLSSDLSNSDFQARLQVEHEDWPKEVTVRGEVVTLPPIRLRLADRITQVTPKNGESIDLSAAELTWSSLPNAVRYSVNLKYRTESSAGGQSTYLFASVSTTKPSLRFSETKDHDRKVIKENLTLGRTGGWSVRAYDANGKCIGVTVEERWFLVAGELKE